MKKKILFVIDSLICAGAEKSLITLLSLIDYSRYDVDLQLFKYGGEFEKYLNKNVNYYLRFNIQLLLRNHSLNNSSASYILKISKCF